MNWRNLKKDLCPKCGEDLLSVAEHHPQFVNIETQWLVCSDTDECGFRCRREKAEEILRSMDRKDEQDPEYRIREEERNLEGLNNL